MLVSHLYRKVLWVAAILISSFVIISPSHYLPIPMRNFKRNELLLVEKLIINQTYKHVYNTDMEADASTFFFHQDRYQYI